MWLSDLKLVLPDRIVERGSIRMEGDIIAEIIEGVAPQPAVSAPDLTAIPGLIDMHGDMLEREIQPRPRAILPIDLALNEIDKRLASCGVTTAYAAVSFVWHKARELRTEEYARKIIQTIHDERPGLLTDLRVHSRFDITNAEAGDVLMELIENEDVHLISIMDHTPGQGQFHDIERYIAFMMQWRKEKMGENLTEADMRAHIERMQSLPKAWGAVESIAKLAGAYHIPLASHDDDSVERVTTLAEFGVTMSEFPVKQEAAEASRKLGHHVVMGAPNAFRGESLSGNLGAMEAIQAGLADMLASDYYPAAMLESAYALTARNIMPFVDSIKLVAENPAAALGLTDRGTLAAGKRADIVLVQEGRRPRVRGTIRGGMPIYWDRYMAERAGPRKWPVENSLVET